MGLNRKVTYVCDTCGGVEDETNTECLPHGWTKFSLREDDGSITDKTICPGCIKNLVRFLQMEAADRLKVVAPAEQIARIRELEKEHADLDIANELTRKRLEEKIKLVDRLVVENGNLYRELNASHQRIREIEREDRADSPAPAAGDVCWMWTGPQKISKLAIVSIDENSVTLQEISGFLQRKRRRTRRWFDEGLIRKTGYRVPRWWGWKYLDG